jgi:putative ABC transport system substrate-binding protein
VSVLLAAPVAALSQRPGKIYRIGYLHPAAPDNAYTALREALIGLGYVDGRNVAFEERFAGGKLDRLPGLAAELVGLKVDIIVAVSPSAIRAARDATTTIPIVMAFSGDDPVKSGFMSSLAHPGGNITGMTTLSAALAPKWVELLHEAVPAANRAAVLMNPDRPDHADQLHAMQEGARPYRMQLHPVEARGPDHYSAAFERMSQARDDSVIVLSGPEYFRDRVRLCELAAAHRLPSVHQYRDFVLVGGLLSYGPNLPDLSARAAVYVDKILKGAKPGDLPVEQPTRFELAINLKTAKALDVAIPQSLLLRADEVIQ